MESRSALRIGLPSGRHIRKEVYKILSCANLSIPFYPTIQSHRVYLHSAFLPSGIAVEFLIDTPRDLIYGLIEHTCDCIITGSDFILDWQAFQSQSSHVPHDWKSAKIKTILTMDRIIRCVGNLCFLRPSNSTYDTLEHFIANAPRPICYTEFPHIASSDLQQCPAYHARYGSLQPLILSSFSSSGPVSRIDQFKIVYSHGLSESKGRGNPDGIVFDLVRTGVTAARNQLEIIGRHEEKIRIGMYQLDSVEVSGSKSRALTEFIKLFEP